MAGPDWDAVLAAYQRGRRGPDDVSLVNTEWQPPTPLVDWPVAYGVDAMPAQWLAKPLLPDQGAVAMFAKGGMGKSLLALWLAAGLATGHVLTGPVEPIEVLYLDYEMTLNTVVDRLEAMGYDDPDALKRLHYASLPTLAPLDSKDGGRAVVDMATHLEVRLVVIDTFGRAVVGEEDKADTVRAWFRWTGQLLKTAGIGFLRIDHAGKDAKRGQRGTSGKNDDVDLVWEMTDRGHGEFLLTTTKRRVDTVPERVVLRQTKDNDVLAYHWVDNPGVTWKPGVKECATLLDGFGAPLDMSGDHALDLLRSHGVGKRRTVVFEALKFRRETGTPVGNPPAPPTSGFSDTTPGTETDTQRNGHGNPPEPPSPPTTPHTRVPGGDVGGEAIPGLFDDIDDTDMEDPT
jgi:hypothetical protein